MNILLVQPEYKFGGLNRNYSFGLQKIATYYLNNGHKVDFVDTNEKLTKKSSTFNDRRYDEILISSIFTFYGREVINTIKLAQKFYPYADIKVGGIFASLMPNYIKEQTGISPHVGLWKEVDDCVANFDLFPKVNRGMCFTTRGCVRKCEFCFVKELEPNFYIMDNWKEQIEHISKYRKELVVQDNNIISTPFKHQKELVAYLKNFNFSYIDFNGGFDCRIFKEKHMKLYSQLNLPFVRFAFDGEQEEGYCQRAIELAKKYMGEDPNKIRIYVLYNFKDKLEYFYYRLNEIWKYGGIVFPMKFSPLGLDNYYIGEHYNNEMLVNIGNLVARCSAGKGMLYPRVSIKERFGDGDFEKFKELLAKEPKTKTKGEIRKIKDKEGFFSYDSRWKRI
jgi:hypothetical protein